jgi:hypothetical protein
MAHAILQGEVWHDATLLGGAAVTRQPHRAKLKDPLVQVAPERLRDAMEDSRLSHRSLGAAIAEATRGNARSLANMIDAVTRGDQRRIRRSQLVAIASRLDVPADWLQGRSDLLGLSFDEGATSDSAAMHRFRRSISRALSPGTGDGALAAEWRRLGLGTSETDKLMRVFQSITHPAFWQGVLLESPHQPIPWDITRYGEGHRHLVAALEIILAPFFGGRANLRVEGVSAILACNQAAAARSSHISHPRSRGPV